MTRKRLGPEHDIGVLHLHADGSVTTGFRFNNVEIHNKYGRFTVDLRRRQFLAQLSELTIPIEQVLDEHFFEHLPEITDDHRIVFTTKQENGRAWNTNTHFLVYRENGCSRVFLSRSKRCRHFVHTGVSWIETDDGDADELMHSMQDNIHSPGH